MVLTLVRVERRDDVARVTLDSPANANALSRQLISELASALDTLAADESVRAVHLRSSGRVFCSGADLKEAHGDGVRWAAAAVVGLEQKIAGAPWPVVVELAGPVRAGGIGLVAAADIVVAADSVSFQLSEVNFGLAPAVISLPLKARIPSRTLADICLTGRRFEAAEAQRMGLVTAVTSADHLSDTVEAYLVQLRGAVRQGLVETKRLLNGSLVAALDAEGDDLAALSADLFASGAARNAMADFLSRRGS